MRWWIYECCISRLKDADFLHISRNYFGWRSRKGCEGAWRGVVPKAKAQGAMTCENVLASRNTSTMENNVLWGVNLRQSASDLPAREAPPTPHHPKQGDSWGRSHFPLSPHLTD